MARAVNRLNARQVATLATPGRHADGNNLYLRVGPTGAKSWLLITTINGKRTELGLGSSTTISLAQARAKALEARQFLDKGVDPRSIWRVARADKAEITFGIVATDYIDGHREGWKNAKHLQQWRNTLATYAAAIWDKPVAGIGVDDILVVLKPIWTAKPETASRVRGRIERVLDAAKVRGLRAGENPALWRGNLALLLPRKSKAPVRHHPAMPFSELPAFMVRLRSQPGLAARALELTILTATRTSETLGARWDEIDLKKKLWVIPAERMKAGREHRIPLSPLAVTLLKSLDRASPLVFPGLKPGRPLSNMAMQMLLRRMGIGHVTVHGFRSTFRDWCAEKTDFPREVAEQALAHVIGNAVERAYRRGDALDKRRELMSAWANFCSGAEVSSEG